MKAKNGGHDAEVLPLWRMTQNTSITPYMAPYQGAIFKLRSRDFGAPRRLVTSDSDPIRLIVRIASL